VSTPLSPAPLIYAHRGDRAHARDNTIDAFELAIANGADGVELDVQHTADYRLVVYHDESHPDAGLIAAVRFDELQRIDPEVPDLAAVFDAIGGRCYINIEIKNAPGPWFDRNRRVADELPVVIAAHGLGESILVSSFDVMSVRKIRERASALLTGQLFTPTDPLQAIEWAARDGHDSANIPLMWTEDTAVIANIHDLGLAVAVWTVNDGDDVRRLADTGVDVIFTDDPGAARAALSAD